MVSDSPTLPKLAELRETLAEAYQADDFQRNPNGYTVAPYVNSDTTATAFSAGFDAASAHYESRVSGLVRALESISKNGCCEQCQEAKLVAKSALKLFKESE